MRMVDIFGCEFVNLSVLLVFKINNVVDKVLVFMDLFVNMLVFINLLGDVFLCGLII